MFRRPRCRHCSGGGGIQNEAWHCDRAGVEDFRNVQRVAVVVVPCRLVALQRRAVLRARGVGAANTAGWLARQAGRERGEQAGGRSAGRQPHTFMDLVCTSPAAEPSCLAARGRAAPVRGRGPPNG